jgi:hypothetical protein
MEPDINELKALLARDAGKPLDRAAGISRRGAKAREEGRAIELAVAAVELLRERGTVTGSDICRMAEILGYEREALVRAWKTRAEFDLSVTPYELEAPIARVLRLL